MDKEIKNLYDELIIKIRKYRPTEDISLVDKAFELAYDAHNGQVRKSGEPYVIHPICVAIILSELEMDFETIIAGLLHDVIEDTDYTYSDISKMFSKEVADLVEGVTKLENIKYSSKEEQQAENYRKMFLAMATDIRVVIIKIADRLHNMRTLKHMPEHKQKEKAQETQDIYAPIAERLGIAKIRFELEDLSFRYLNPEQYYDLAHKIKVKQEERKELVNNIVDEIQKIVGNANINASVAGRPKHFFSIYKKMKNQNKTLEQIYDIIAIRVLVDDVRDCYAILGIVHENYKPIQGRFKDYIAMPKANMYQSLHNTLISSTGLAFEIQIRTYEMHKISEYGIAAHWKYKRGGEGNETQKEEAKLNWLRQVLEWQKEMEDNEEFLSSLKSEFNLYKNRVYCFTPEGKVIELAAGAVPIDFAYHIHSAIGNKMVGAKVNGAMVPISHKLKNGDIVEIITSGNSKGPSRDWLNIVASSNSRSKINSWFRKQSKEESLLRGKELVEKDIKHKGYKPSDLLVKEFIENVLRKYSYKDLENLYVSIGYSAVKEGQVVNKLIEEYKKANGIDIEKNEDVLKKLQNDIEEKENFTKKRNAKANEIEINGLGLVEGLFSKCCNPLPGDEICGFVTRGRGVTVHRTDCTNIVNLSEGERNRVIEAYWPANIDTSKQKFNIGLKVIAYNRNNLLFDITKIMSEQKIDIINFNTRHSDDTVLLKLEIQVKNLEQAQKIKTTINNLESVIEVTRLLG